MVTFGVVVVAVVAMALTGQSEAYSTGAPTLRLDQMMSSMCGAGNMRPGGHRTSGGTQLFPKRTPPPFTLTATLQGPASTVYRPGSKIKVTLTGNAGHKFKGFFITGDGEDAKAGLKGSFDAETPRQSVKRTTFCREGITHTDGRLPKTSVSVIWTAPANFTHGSIRFIATVVEQFDTFYTGVMSNVVHADVSVTKQSVYAQNQMRQMLGSGGSMFGGVNLQEMMKNMRGIMGQGMMGQGRPPSPGGGFMRNFGQA